MAGPGRPTPEGPIAPALARQLSCKLQCKTSVS
jgi:hypothetical protein